MRPRNRRKACARSRSAGSPTSTPSSSDGTLIAMAPRRLDLDDLASVLPPGGRVLVGGCSGESLVLADAVMQAGPRLGATTFTGVFVPGLNKQTYLANSECRVETFFLT